MTFVLPPEFDARLTPARGDLAAAQLEGCVAADRFVQGQSMTVVTGVADLRREPRPDGAVQTQLLFGETVKLYDDDNGWAWVQAERDGYVGYVAASALARPREAATHKVIANRTFVYPAPDMKQPPIRALPLDARLAAARSQNHDAYLRLSDQAFVFRAHVAEIGWTAPDYVAVAEKLVGVPYLWGGRTPLGIDCSGLVQLSMSLAGVESPRDSDLQEKVWPQLPSNRDAEALRRGDLVFWKGHVGIMSDKSSLLHANAHHMLVSIEPLSLVRERVERSGQVISSLCRPVI